MKGIYFYLVLFLFCSCSKKSTSEVYYKNGDIKEGYVKTPKKRKYNTSFKFKELATKKKTRLSSNEVEKVVLKVKDSQPYYGSLISRFVKIKGHRKPIFLQEKLVGDKVSLYENSYTRTSRMGSFANGNQQTSDYTQQVHYIKIPGDDEAFPLRIGRKGKKAKEQLSELFKDCPELVEKIQSDYYEFVKMASVFHIPNIFRDYNTKCN